MNTQPQINNVVNGFIESMYFADAYNDDEDGDSGLFNGNLPLSSQTIAVISNYCTSVVNQLPQAVFELDADRIGNCIYYHTMGHGTGFYDDLSLSDADNKTIDDIFDRYNCEVYSDESKAYFTFTVKA